MLSFHSVHHKVAWLDVAALYRTNLSAVHQHYVLQLMGRTVSVLVPKFSDDLP